tara:strand:- start:163 stop:657 length:495 start_codon:yes stop_codon:yes gene_type:complete
MSEIIITPSDPVDITLSNEFNTIELTSETNKIVISEKGVQGSQGARGSQGEKGDTGDKGDTGEGVPSGGTSGQILSKVDDTDYNTEWTDVTDTFTWIDVAGDIQYNGNETPIASGNVLEGVYKTNTIYRFINGTNNANGYPIEDSFYSDFDGTNLTNLIVTRGL